MIMISVSFYTQYCNTKFTLSTVVILYLFCREGDTALWLHNKLGSTDDLWSGASICSQLSRDKLLSIHDCFHNLQPYVKVKLMLSFLHLPKRSLEEVSVD